MKASGWSPRPRGGFGGLGSATLLVCAHELAGVKSPGLRSCGLLSRGCVSVSPGSRNSLTLNFHFTSSFVPFHVFAVLASLSANSTFQLSAFGRWLYGRETGTARSHALLSVNRMAGAQ